MDGITNSSINLYEGALAATEERPKAPDLLEVS